jgi:hypothetical protein
MGWMGYGQGYGVLVLLRTYGGFTWKKNTHQLPFNYILGHRCQTACVHIEYHARLHADPLALYTGTDLI